MNPIEKLQEAGVAIQEDPLVSEEAATSGASTQARISAEPTEDGYSLTVHLREKLPTEDIEAVADWAAQRIEALQQHGPEHDDWSEDDDGLLDLWLVQDQ